MKSQSKTHLKTAGLLCFSLLITACTGPTISIARLSGDSYAPVAADRVEVIATGVLKRPYKEIGIIDVEEGPGSQTYDEMIQALRVRVGAIGADAVIIDTSKKNHGAMFVGGMLLAIDGKFIKAVAVRWTEQRGPSLPVSVLPVLIPPLLSTSIQRLAVVPLSDTTDPKISSWLDLTLNFLRSRHPQIVLVERETLGLALEEVQLQNTGRVADESMVRVGRLVGADTLLTYRLDSLSGETIASVRRNGGQVLGSAEFRLINVESGTTLFRQAVTATVTLATPGGGKAWPEESVHQVHRAAMENAVSYGLASLTMAYGDNVLGLVPDLTSVKDGVTILGVLQGGPAHGAGIKANDRIVSLNGQPFTSWAMPITLPAAFTIEREGKTRR